MADLKITQLPADTTPTTDDLLVTVDNPGGTPTDKKVTIADFIKTFLGDGWIPTNDTFAYASASSFTISGVDRTAIYTKGTKIKFTNNSTTFYGVVASSAFSTDTTVTHIANSDYAIANSAITAPFYSYQQNPQGYPGWFNYAETWTGFSASPSAGVVRFSVVGNTVLYNLERTGLGTSNATTMTVTLPVAASSVSSNASRGLIKVIDNGAVNNSPGLWDITAGVSIVTFFKNLDTTAFTASGGKLAVGLIPYEF